MYPVYLYENSNKTLSLSLSLLYTKGETSDNLREYMFFFNPSLERNIRTWLLYIKKVYTPLKFWETNSICSMCLNPDTQTLYSMSQQVIKYASCRDKLKIDLRFSRVGKKRIASRYINISHIHTNRR